MAPSKGQSLNAKRHLSHAWIYVCRTDEDAANILARAYRQIQREHYNKHTGGLIQQGRNVRHWCTKCENYRGVR